MNSQNFKTFLKVIKTFWNSERKTKPLKLMNQPRTLLLISNSVSFPQSYQVLLSSLLNLICEFLIQIKLIFFNLKLTWTTGKLSVRIHRGTLWLVFILSVSGLSFQILSWTCPGQKFSLYKAPHKKLKLKNSRTGFGQKILLCKNDPKIQRILCRNTAEIFCRTCPGQKF